MLGVLLKDMAKAVLAFDDGSDRSRNPGAGQTPLERRALKCWNKLLRSAGLLVSTAAKVSTAITSSSSFQSMRQTFAGTCWKLKMTSTRRDLGASVYAAHMFCISNPGILVPRLLRT